MPGPKRRVVGEAERRAASSGAASASMADGPSDYWRGKPWYSDIELREIQLLHHDRAKPDDAQCIHWREATRELARRGR